MKKLFALTLIAALLLSGCGRESAPAETRAPETETTTAATAAPATVPTEVPTTEAATEPKVLYVNPLTGEEVDEPFDRRIFGFTIGNTREALPHYGVSRADILFESFVNGLTTRRFAMYSDVRDVDSIGGVRSMRVQWTDLCQGYDAVAVHAAGSNYVLGDMKASRVDNIYGEQWNADFHYRDKDRIKAGTSQEHCLYVRGNDLVNYAEEQGIRVTQDPNKNYGMQFSAVPDSSMGEAAQQITITFELSRRKKDTIMTYDPESGSYTMNQYGVDMVDGIYDNAPELYKNVFALYFPYHYEAQTYHVPETVGMGEGFFACDGRIIPILWHRDANDAPFYFTLPDGSPLTQGIGNSYVAMIPTGSQVVWGEPELSEEEAEAVEAAAAAAPAEETAETLSAEKAAAPETEAPEETAAPETEAAMAPEAAPEETFDLSDVEVDD